MIKTGNKNQLLGNDHCRTRIAKFLSVDYILKVQVQVGGWLGTVEKGLAISWWPDAP